MTDQIETYLREQFAADSERSPLAHDLAGAALDRVRRQRRRTAGSLAAGLAVLVLLAGIVVGLGDSSRTSAPPAEGSTASPSPTASPSTTASEAPGVLAAALERPNAYTREIAVLPWGGRVYCNTVEVGASADGDERYVWARCSHIYAMDGKATDGAGMAGPVVLHVTHGLDADGQDRVTGVRGIDFPRIQTLDADIGRLFPAGVAEKMLRGNLPNRAGDDQMMARAQADIDAGRLGAAADGPALAARFFRYAKGETNALPVDTPVGLYLGNKYLKTISNLDLDNRRVWEICAQYAERDCPMSAVSVLRNDVDLPTITPGLPHGGCLVKLTDEPTDTGGVDSAVLQPLNPATCTDEYAVQVWFNDVGQITAVNLLLGG